MGRSRVGRHGGHSRRRGGRSAAEAGEPCGSGSPDRASARRCGIDEVEALRLCLPGLELSDMDLGRQPSKVAASLRGELRSHLNADDRESAVQQRPGCLAGRAADFQQAIARLEPGQFDEVVKQFARIGRPRRVVQVGGRVEGPPQRVERLAHALKSSRTRQVQEQSQSAGPACGNVTRRGKSAAG
jgi:hypothetical protein